MFVGSDARVGDTRPEDQVPEQDRDHQPKAVEQGEWECHHLKSLSDEFPSYHFTWIRIIERTSHRFNHLRQGYFSSTKTDHHPRQPVGSSQAVRMMGHEFGCLNHVLDSCTLRG